MRGDTWKIVLTIVLIIAAIFYLWPTFQWFTMSASDRTAMQQNNPDAFANLQKKALKLGLDLQGGMRVVLEVDKSQLDDNAKQDARDRALEIIRNRVDQFGVAEPVIQAQGSDRIVVELPALQDPERARNLIGKTALLEFRLVESPENSDLLIKRLDQIAGKLSPDAAKTPTADTAATPFADPFADTTKLAADTTKDTTAALANTDQSNVLTQYLDFNGVAYQVTEEDYAAVDRIVNNPEIKAALPADVELAWAIRPEMINGRQRRQLYILKKKVELTGAHLKAANPNYDQFHKPVVDFELDREGGEIFGKLTGANINKPLAILLDGRVESAPNIRSKIRDRGQITLGGNATFFDAKDMATILRAGALPAPVKIVENNVIGPTLGKDSVDAGINGLLISFIVVAAFMIIYYKLAGVVADIVLFLNILFLLAVMAALGATLTLPGIAGIILTIGMAVDANVLIFERMREEVRTGKKVAACIEAGYERALASIVDSNLTTLIAAGVLYYFGTGPIRGFAVTLGAGIIISMYTALVVSKLILHTRRNAATLSV
ncbi:MAG: protein translocase subunit SecD [candidate division Zixibacteria bacterium]|nr:protein translocase subunit SecD [candidate division Zixibacteria bacterium]